MDNERAMVAVFKGYTGAINMGGANITGISQARRSFLNEVAQDNLKDEQMPARHTMQTRAKLCFSL